MIISGVVCFDGHWGYTAGIVTGRSDGLLQVVSTSVQTLNVELTILARDHFNSFFTGCVLDGVVELAFLVESYFIIALCIAVQLEASTRQCGTIHSVLTLGVAQLVGVHIDWSAFGSFTNG